MSVLGDGAGSPIDQGVTTLLFLGALLFGWVAVSRLRGRGFHRLPRGAGWGAGAVAVAALVLAFALPPILRPDPVAVRPSSSARLVFLSPAPGQVLRGRPASVPVRIQLTGGRIVATTSTRLIPGAGHVHLYLDGRLVAMTVGLRQALRVQPGPHRLTAEFVAVDHGPFDPQVLASVAFEVQAGS